MKKNVGNTDKIVRVVLALLAAYFAYTKNFEAAWMTYALYAVSIVLLFTVLTSNCLLYTLLGKSTCKMK